jgi:tRNA threonylcarbamoyladenosine biosynthesis protein TsaB
MEFYMLVLALDTTTRRGSVALARDGAVLDASTGDPAVTHGQRLPGDVIRLLDRHGLRIGDVELFAVAAGPGSFTGLRIGIATMQGFALANSRGLVGVSALDALHVATRSLPSALSPQPSALDKALDEAVWMDAQRGEVFAALYRGGAVIEGPVAEKPGELLVRWRAAGYGALTFVGDGAMTYADLIRGEMPDAVLPADVPPLAPAIALLAEEQARHQQAPSPDAIRPIYVRRPDVELTRERKAGR